MEKTIYPTDEEAKETILDIGKRMYIKNFVAANDGNISCRVGEDTIWVTPTGVSKGYMAKDILVKMSLDGEILESGALGPSSEIKMHILIYRENPEVMGVTHAHPVVCTSFAVAGIALDKAIYPEALVTLGSVPCLHYETPGSHGVVDSIRPYCKTYHALLLGNHGALSWGRSLTEAFYRMEAMEHYAAILMNTGVLGRANVLSHDQIGELVKIRQSIGITTGKIPEGVPKATNLEDIL